jgi:hypothetical protein
VDHLITTVLEGMRESECTKSDTGYGSSSGYFLQEQTDKAEEYKYTTDNINVSVRQPPAQQWEKGKQYPEQY